MKAVPDRARSAHASNPGALVVCPLLDRVRISRDLDELVRIPDRHVAHEFGSGKLLDVWQSLAGDLLLVHPHRPPTCDDLHRLGEDAGFAGEANVTVVRLLAQRHVEANAQALDEIFLLVAVEDEGVNHADLIRASEEVESNDERQPGAIGGKRFVLARDLHHGAHRAGLLDRDRVDLAGEFFFMGRVMRVVVRAIFSNANQRSVGSDLLADRSRSTR